MAANPRTVRESLRDGFRIQIIGVIDEIGKSPVLSKERFRVHRLCENGRMAETQNRQGAGIFTREDIAGEVNHLIQDLRSADVVRMGVENPVILPRTGTAEVQESRAVLRHRRRIRQGKEQRPGIQGIPGKKDPFPDEKNGAGPEGVTGERQKPKRFTADVQDGMIFCWGKIRNRPRRKELPADIGDLMTDSVFVKIPGPKVRIAVPFGKIEVGRGEEDLLEFSRAACVIQMAVCQKNRVRLTEGKMILLFLQKRPKTSISETGVNQNAGNVPFYIVCKDISRQPDAGDPAGDALCTEQTAVGNRIR